MKKAFLVLTAVLLAVLMAGCNDIAGEDDDVVYGPNGEELVPIRFSIDRGGNARSLIAAEAQNETDFLEVVFEKGGTPYRKTWKAIDTGTVNIPRDFDLETDKAVVFAGQSSTSTLLAVGLVSAINGTAVTYPIAAATPIAKGDKVTFKMGKLSSLVSGTGSTTTFKILTPTATPTGALPTQKFNGTDIPVYEVAASETATASYTLSISGGLASANTTTHFSYVILRGAGKVNSMGATLDNGQKKTKIENASISNATASDASANAPLPATLALTFDTTTDGVCQIAIEVPVQAVNAANSPHPWFVRGGLPNGNLDAGTGVMDYNLAVDGSGGSILLGIGDTYMALKTDNEVVIDWTP